MSVTLQLQLQQLLVLVLRLFPALTAVAVAAIE